MHELTVADALIDRALEAAEGRGHGELSALTVEVGEATHVRPGQLRRCVETVAERTDLGEVEVAVEPVEPKARCGCGWSGQPETVPGLSMAVPEQRCPVCGDSIELTAGTGCRLASITVPDPPVQDV